MVPGIRINTSEFQRTLRSYVQHSKKDVADIINAKAFFIARGAARNTMMASKEDIRSGLWKEVSIKGKPAPLVGVMAEKWAKEKYGKGYSPKSKAGLSALKAAVKQIQAARMRARAFMRSGWIPAIKGFARKMDAKDRFEAGKRHLGMSESSFKNPKGGFSAANPGILARAILWNASVAKRGEDPGGKLDKIAGAALKEAIDDETASMRAYIERKMRERIRRVR